MMVGAVLNRTQRPQSETVAGKGLCGELETLERKKAKLVSILAK